MTREQANKLFIELNKKYNKLNLNNNLDYADYDVWCSEFYDKHFGFIDYYMSINIVDEDKDIFDVKFSNTKNVHFYLYIFITDDNMWGIEVSGQRYNDSLYYEIGQNDNLFNLIEALLVSNKYLIKD